MAALFGAPSAMIATDPDVIYASVTAEMSAGADAPAPETDPCPMCGLHNVEVEQSLALTFPIRFQCRCLDCKHEWERIDD